MLVVVESETDQRRRYLQSWVVATTQSEKRRGARGVGRESKGQGKGAHGDAEKREG